MNITIIGTGYVGLVTGTCFAEMGNKVICADIDTVKIDKINQGVIPIYEPGLDKLVRVNRERKTISFTSDIQTAIESADVICIAVGTPQGEDGSADLKHVLAVAKDIGSYLKSYAVVIDKSTVPVGTAEKVKFTIKHELEKRNSDLTFDVVSNPEFLKEGAAIDDFMKPDRVVVGAESDHAMGVMRELYRPFTFNRQRFVEMDIRSAEMTKYAANAMLATKISFMNEVAAICEKVGADVNKVRAGIGSDSRIGYSFIYPGIGYGGSCFPQGCKSSDQNC
jgi:UDPglucose 6-dehydrogenase